MRTLGLLAFAACLGCSAKLPEQVPFIVNVGGPEKSTDLSAALVLLGAPLVHDGQVIGPLVGNNTAISVEAHFVKPKAELRKVLAGGFAVRMPGACGMSDIPLEPPTSKWAEVTDERIAERVASEKALPVYVRMTSKALPQVIVDWGTASSIMIGTLKVEKPEKNRLVTVPLEGCKEAPRIVADGKEVGTLALDAPVQLISVPEGVCYVDQIVNYGNAQASGEPTYYSGKRVYPLAHVPGYLLESAPLSLKTRGGGTTASELVRATCPAAK